MKLFKKSPRSKWTARERSLVYSGIQLQIASQSAYGNINLCYFLGHLTDNIPLDCPEIDCLKPDYDYGELWWRTTDRESRIHFLDNCIVLAEYNLIENRIKRVFKHLTSCLR